jgi:hypothetical protein
MFSLKKNLMKFKEKIVKTYPSPEFQNKHSKPWKKICTHLKTKEKENVEKCKRMKLDSIMNPFLAKCNFLGS